MNKKHVNLLGLMHLVFIIVLLIMFIKFGDTYYDRWVVLNQFNKSVIFFSAIIFYFTYAIFFLSIAYIFYFDFNKAIMFGFFESSINLVILIIFIIVYTFEYLINKNAIYFITYSMIIAGLVIINTILFTFKSSQTINKEALIRKTILDLGTKYDRLEVKEISEECNVNKNSIIIVIKKMIQNREIFAEYFNSSKSVSFNLQSNINEIDELMAKYNEWEEQQVVKI